MRFLVVLTGGTISSVVEDGVVVPDKHNPAKIIEKYKEKYGTEDRFELTCPYTLNSENMNCSFYPRLIACLKEASMKNYDGIIVTHGTSSLQFTAAALSLTLTGKNCPIVLVASDYVIEDERANGLDNLKGAVDFVKGGYGRGIYVSYKNKGGNVRIHQGIKCMPYETYSFALNSFNDEYFGEFVDGEWVPNENCPKLVINKRYKIIDNTPEDSGILWIKQYPGMKYPKVDSFVKAVMLEAYPNGTINVSSKEVKEFVKQLRNYDIPVYVTGVNDDYIYASRSDYEGMGFKVLPKESPVAAYVKLWLMYRGEELV